MFAKAAGGPKRAAKCSETAAGKAARGRRGSKRAARAAAGLSRASAAGAEPIRPGAPPEIDHPPLPLSPTMPLFNRKKAASTEGNSEKKQGWRRPASASLSPLSPPASSPRPRHRLQAAASQGMAAHPHPQDCPAHPLHHRLHLCPHWRRPHLGLRLGLGNDI